MGREGVRHRKSCTKQQTSVIVAVYVHVHGVDFVFGPDFVFVPNFVFGPAITMHL